MCTVSIVNLPGNLLRIAINRDEQHTRPAALPPQMQIFGEHRAILPIDRGAGGTWAAVSDAGLAMVLLNRNLGTSTAARKSRGLIIPSLLHCDSPVNVLQAIANFDPHEFSPFRLLAIDRQTVGRADSDGRRLQITAHPIIDEPLMFTSSGLGDELVDAPRRELFESLSLHSAEAQDRFHKHCWVAVPHLSVCMSREDARTVSYSVIELWPDSARFSYHADAPNLPAKNYELSFDQLAVAV
jgi:uncharacterized protein with NRDE domain